MLKRNCGRVISGYNILSNVINEKNSLNIAKNIVS